MKINSMKYLRTAFNQGLNAGLSVGCHPVAFGELFYYKNDTMSGVIRQSAFDIGCKLSHVTPTTNERSKIFYNLVIKLTNLQIKKHN